MQERKINQQHLLIKKIIIYSVFIILTILSLLVGLSDVSLKSLFNFNQSAWFILFKSRAPRTIAIILTGASLTVGGLIMQIISRNKFVSPSTMGTTNAAQLSMIVTLVFVNLPSLTGKLIISFTFAFFLPYYLLCY